jgi:hypothetical protein
MRNRIRIQQLKLMRIHADPDPKPCWYRYLFKWPQKYPVINWPRGSGSIKIFTNPNIHSSKIFDFYSWCPHSFCVHSHHGESNEKRTQKCPSCCPLCRKVPYGILCLPDGFLGDLDGVDHAVQSMAGSLHCPELTARYLRQLQKLLVIPEL